MEESEIPDLILSIWKRWRSESPVGQGLITQEQYWFLRTLRSDGPMRLKDLAARLGCTPSTASIAVKRLERSNLVARKREVEDEREVKVELTERGRVRLEDWRRAQLKLLGAVFDGLTDDERRRLRSILIKALGLKKLEGARTGGGGMAHD